MALPTYGPMAVDWEQRINFDRLHDHVGDDRKIAGGRRGRQRCRQ